MIQAINGQRAVLGSMSNRLDSTVSNLTNVSSNLQAGRGRIEDADFAAETTSLAKSQTLSNISLKMTVK
jgi:flagellin